MYLQVQRSDRNKKYKYKFITIVLCSLSSLYVGLQPDDDPIRAETRCSIVKMKIPVFK